MSDEAVKNRQQVDDINSRFMADEISKEQALAELKPIADRVNKKAKEIAKKYNMKPRLVRIEATKSHGAKLR